MNRAPFALSLILPFVLAAAAGTVRAQQTWVVAEQGAAPFRDIQAAVDHATSGDVIVVRAGTYSGFRVRNKSLSILGDPGATVGKGQNQSILYSSNLASTVNVLRGVHVASTVAAQVSAIGYDGLLVFDGVVTSGEADFCDFTHCELIHIERCSLRGRILFQSGTNGVVVDSVLRGRTLPAGRANKQRAVVEGNGASGRSLYLAATSIMGADAIGVNDLPGAAIEANSQMRIVLSGVATDRIVAGKGALSRSAIEGPLSGTGQLILDPRLRVQANGSAAPVSWYNTVVRRSDPVLRSTAAVVGQPMTLDVVAPPSFAHVLHIGAPSIPVWIEPFGVLGLRNTTPIQAALGSARASFAVPNQASLRGVYVAWQTIGLDATGVRTSNISATTLR